jgi:type I restriction enzyme S subunit
MAHSQPLTRFERLLVEPVRNGIYKPKQFHGRGAKIVNMGELFAHPRLRAVPMKRVELSESEIERFTLMPGDLLFARRSLVAEGAGKCSVVLEVDDPTAFESSIIRARPDTAKADSLYLYYFFNSPLGLHGLDTIRRQVAVAGITGTDLSALELPVPSLEEQRAIGEVLAALDDKIELNRRMNATAEDVARAIFKSWFVDFDPVRVKVEGRPVYGLDDETAALFPDGFTDSERGPIPRGWAMSSIGEEYRYVMGQSPPGSSYNEIGEGVPLFQGKGEFDFRYPTVRLFCTQPKRMASAGDTLVSVRAPVGSMNMAQVECCIGRGLAAVRHKSGSASLTYYSMRELSAAFTAYDSEGTVFGSINKKAFGEIRCLRIPEPLVSRVDELLAPIDALISVKEEERRTLAGLRDSLLPRLVSGEIRVRDAERLAEAAV